jgi:aminopeptidase N
MVRRRLALAFLSFVLLVNARQRAVGHPSGWPITDPPADSFSFSNSTEVATKHLSLDLTVDFTAKKLRGSATLDLENRTGTNALILDTFALDITRVTLDHSTTATWSLGSPSAYGRPLQIAITPQTESVTIEYATASSPHGLFWSTAEQSFGRTEPYLYSLNEPVGARGWIPIQDTPSMRMTYDATLRVPRGLMALMSAANNPTATNDTGMYTFDMPYRIPSYLIALAVGRLQFHPFDERTGVYAEPELLESAAWELAYLPEMVDAAERIVGPFPFARHDLLLMPPTFVVGGMEHPMLNFIAPFGLITGNRPSTLTPSSLIAHELAHSWAGDLATLANWNDVWINEGVTSYLTLRILEEMSGVERAEYSWYSDREDFADYVQFVPAEDTILHRSVPSAGYGFSGTSYVKGGLFLKMLEDEIGRPTFDFFLRRYFQVFAFRWVDDQNFVAALRAFAIRGNAPLEQRLALDQWLYGPGLPSNVTAAKSSTLLSRVTERGRQFTSGTRIEQLSPASWSELEIELFLQTTTNSAIVARMAEIDSALGLSARNAPPITWLHHAISARYAPAMPALERVLMRGGPSGTVTSLYSALVRVGDVDRATRIFNEARDRYSDSVELQVARLLGLSSMTAIRQAA